MSSLFSSNGASMIFLSKKFSDSTSNLCRVTLAILSQWRSFIALLAINSRSGQHSLKSSIFFFSSLNACHSLRALGSLRHLSKQHQMRFINILIIVITLFIIIIVIIITVIIIIVIKIIIIITITNNIIVIIITIKIIIINFSGLLNVLPRDPMITNAMKVT